MRDGNELFYWVCRMFYLHLYFKGIFVPVVWS